MLKPFRKVVKFASSAKGAKIVLFAWLAVAILLSVIAPGAKEYSISSKEGSVKGNTPTAIAEDILKEDFPSNEGLTGLFVFHRNEKITDGDREKISQFTEWLSSDDAPKYVTSVLPFHTFPSEVQTEMFSEDMTTILINFTLEEELDTSLVHDTLENIQTHVNNLNIGDLQFEITGPAGIAADTITIFKNADVVLMIGTVVLIFIILIIIYRSPLLAVIPLAIAAIVYSVVDRVLGIAGKSGLFIIDDSAVSIMLVLLFAVLTDYSLFVFSRYREKLQEYESKYDAMANAIYHVSEPIVFSGSTILLAVLTLFVTVFQPYNHFAPVFSVAVVFITIAGLTLIPSIFALTGRKAFWPFIPDQEKKDEKKPGLWKKVSNLVVKRPAMLVTILLTFLILGVANIPSIYYSFNLLKSFPDDISSRKGFELLETHYPPGQLAPVTVILQSEKEVMNDPEFLENMENLAENLQQHDGVDSVQSELTNGMLEDFSKFPADLMDEKEKTVKFQFVLKDNPYDIEALNVIHDLRKKETDLLEKSGFDVNDVQLHFAGQTAEQVDVREMNKRDTIVLFSLVTLFITAMLALQTRSLKMAFFMIGTILLSYGATLGFSWLIFQYIFGYEAISYRLPVYTFVFMIALGIDYNIMLVSRIREEAHKYTWKEAIRRALEKTGGVISSAGVILAATFSVLMTQPLQELFLFGFTMAIGILLDTFLIRGMLLPSMLLITHKKENKTVEKTAV